MATRDYIGTYPEELPVSAEHLTVVFSAASATVTQRWKNKNLSADFLADYFANFFPRAEDADGQSSSREEIRSAVGFIANELLENAFKFNFDADCTMSIQIYLHHDSVTLLSTNSIDPAKAADLKAFVRSLIVGDPGELYLQQLEKNAESDTSSSGMGLLTMLNDYGATLGWRFTRVPLKTGAARMVLTTAVSINF